MKPGAKLGIGALFIGSFVPALLFGVALGNVIQGRAFPFRRHHGSFFTPARFGRCSTRLPYCGAVSVAMLVFHGGVYLMHRTEGHCVCAHP